MARCHRLGRDLVLETDDEAVLVHLRCDANTRSGPLDLDAVGFGGDHTVLDGDEPATIVAVELR